MTQIRESRHTARTSHNTNGGDIEVLKTDTRFATKLDSIDDVPEPMHEALLEKVPSHQPIRLLVHAPDISTNEEESPISATLLAVTSEGWLVVSERAEGNVSVEDCKFA